MSDIETYKILNQGTGKLDFISLNREQVDLLSNNKGLKDFEFSKVKFFAPVRFEKKTVSGSLIFLKCEFKSGDFILDGCIFLGYTHIVFKDCKFSSFSISNIVKNSPVDIEFSGCIFSEKFLIENVDLEKIRIDNCRFNQVNFHKFEINELRVYDSFFDIVRWSLVKAVSITMIGNKIEDANLKSICSMGRITTLTMQITKNLFNCEFSIGNINASQIFVNENYGKGRFVLALSEGYLISKEIHFYDNELEGGVRVLRDRMINKAQQIDIDFLLLKCSGKMLDRFSIENLCIERLNILGVNPNSMLHIDSCDINKFEISNFINTREFLLTNIKSISGPNSETYISIKESNLGKAQFYNVNLKSFQRFIYLDSEISQISTSNITWFDSKKLSHQLKIMRGLSDNDKITLRLEFKRQKDLFRQLKIIMERQGDRSYALTFFRWEMWNFRKTLKLKKGTWKDRWILFVGESNNHGTNWFKPFYTIFPFTFILYVPIALASSPEIDFFSLSFKWSDIKMNIEIILQKYYYWMQLLNPAHALDRIIPNINSAPGIIHFFDILMRIVVSILIFQIVSAFRKLYKS